MSVKKFTDRQTREIQNFVNICLHIIDDATAKATAEKTGLCVSTIYNLRHERVSASTHIGTIMDLASAAGLKLGFTKNGRVYMEAA